VEESRRNPAESSAVHTGVCRVPDSRPSPYRRHRGPLDGGPLHRKIRPPGASRRRATDIHVTLLPYRYQPRRHKEREREGRAGAGEEERRGGEIILYFSYEPVRYVSSSVRQQCRVRALDGTGRKPSERIPPSSPRDREGSLGRFGHSIICGNAIPLSRFSGRRGWTMSLCSLVSCFRGMTAAETET